MVTRIVRLIMITVQHFQQKQRSMRKHNSNFPSFHMEPHTEITITQDKFLLNERNKI